MEQLQYLDAVLILMKKTLFIGVLMAAVLTMVLLTITVPTFAENNTTDVISNQKAVVSGIKPNVQLCEQINDDSPNTGILIIPSQGICLGTTPVP